MPASLPFVSYVAEIDRDKHSILINSCGDFPLVGKGHFCVDWDPGSSYMSKLGKEAASHQSGLGGTSGKLHSEQASAKTPW